VKVKVEFASPHHADGASNLPFVTRLDGRTVMAEMPDMPAAFRAFRSMSNMAG